MCVFIDFVFMVNVRACCEVCISKFGDWIISSGSSPDTEQIFIAPVRLSKDLNSDEKIF